MRKIFINGHGWSGSSAFIDFLNKTPRNEYVVIPGEFDDFRVPGTMRAFLDINNLSKPLSHRARSRKSLFKLWLRSLINDRWLQQSSYINQLSRAQASSLLRSNSTDLNISKLLPKVSLSKSIRQKNLSLVSG